MTRDGELVEIEGRRALRFERDLPYPVERVWRAVSTRDELGAWFVVPWEPREAGQRFEAMGQPGEILRFEPPHALEWEWGGERFSFDLAEASGGTRLVFIHVFLDESRAADFAGGWHFHLVNRLEAHLDGEPVPEGDRQTLEALNDRYSERFGVDPEVGRRVLAQHFGAG